MAHENVHEFTDTSFETEVVKSETPVLVDFWAEWCTPCKMLTPTIDALAEQFKGKFKVGKVDTDGNRAVSMKYGITAIPTVILFKGGQPVKKFVGLAKKDDIAAAMNAVLAG
jgi:thioredoxin 1